MDVKADFLADLGEIANDRLDQLGAPSIRSAPWFDSLKRFLTVEHRLVPIQPREASWSAELKARPADAWTAEVERIAKESEAGDDLSHYLSRGVFDAKTDALLNDWG